MLQQITVVVKSLRHLPQQFFTEEKERELALSRHGHGHQRGHGHGHQGRGGVDFRRCLRAQASIVNETRETGNSVWGRGVRSREATWLRGSDKLCWSLPEQQFKQVKAYTPVCKVRVRSFLVSLYIEAAKSGKGFEYQQQNHTVSTSGASRTAQTTEQPG